MEAKFPHWNTMVIMISLILTCVSTPAIGREVSVIAPLATHSLLLDAQAVGDLLVAVGERGHILLSEDRGNTLEAGSRPDQGHTDFGLFH